MPPILAILIWAATIDNTLSTYHGFQVVLGATTLLADTVCIVGTILVIGMALSSSYILTRTGGFRWTFRGIWVASLAFGLFCAWRGNLSFFAPDILPADQSDNGFLAAIAPYLKMKGLLILFVTVVCAFLSTIHSMLPERFGGGMFGLYRVKGAPHADKPPLDV